MAGPLLTLIRAHVTRDSGPCVSPALYDVTLVNFSHLVNSYPSAIQEAHGAWAVGAARAPLSGPKGVTVPIQARYALHGPLSARSINDDFFYIINA